MPRNANSSDRQEPADYDRFDRFETASYEDAENFLRRHVTFTPREWVIARLCADFRTGTGVELTTVGENLPALVPFMEEPYSRQAVYAARRSFEEKVRTAGGTFLYGALSGFFTADELEDVVYESTEVAKLLLAAEGVSLEHDRETEVERAVRAAMEDVREASVEVRYDRCPHCGEDLRNPDGSD